MPLGAGVVYAVVVVELWLRPKCGLLSPHRPHWLVT